MSQIKTVLESIYDACEEYFSHFNYIPNCVILGDRDWDKFKNEMEQLAVTDTGLEPSGTIKLNLPFGSASVNVTPAFERNIRMPYGLILSDG